MNPNRFGLFATLTIIGAIGVGLVQYAAKKSGQSHNPAPFPYENIPSQEQLYHPRGAPSPNQSLQFEEQPSKGLNQLTPTQETYKAEATSAPLEERVDGLRREQFQIVRTDNSFVSYRSPASFNHTEEIGSYQYEIMDATNPDLGELRLVYPYPAEIIRLSQANITYVPVPGGSMLTKDFVKKYVCKDCDVGPVNPPIRVDGVIVLNGIEYLGGGK